MKKRFVIILVIQSVIIFLMFIYAFIQKLEADKNLMEAVRQEHIATENLKHAQELEVQLYRLKVEWENQTK